MIILVQNKDFPGEEPTRLMIDYFSPLSKVLTRFQCETDCPVTSFENKYGQSIPLTYRVQKTGLTVYYRFSKKKRVMITSSNDESEN